MSVKQKTPTMTQQYLENPDRFFPLKEIGLNFKGISHKSARTWARFGVRCGRSLSAPKVMLAVFKRGATLMTTREAVEQFLTAANGG